LTDEQQELLARTLNSVERLRSLVIDVLDLARLEAGPALRVGKVDLGEVIGQAVHEIEPLTREKEQILVSDAPPDLPYALGDAALLTRALANLLSNASKYTPQRWWVTVRAFLARPQDTVIHVEVQDTGRGIPAEALPHLFERFYRVPGSEDHAEGTGLGLSIVQSIVEKHGGHIWVDSTLGEGSTFTFTVPIKA
jgi:signal transduction histidine kinase